jgi:argininosuccinate lyase
VLENFVIVGFDVHLKMNTIFTVQVSFAKNHTGRSRNDHVVDVHLYHNDLKRAGQSLIRLDRSAEKHQFVVSVKVAHPSCIPGDAFLQGL